VKGEERERCVTEQPFLYDLPLLVYGAAGSIPKGEGVGGKIHDPGRKRKGKKEGQSSAVVLTLLLIIFHFTLLRG